VYNKKILLQEYLMTLIHYATVPNITHQHHNSHTNKPTTAANNSQQHHHQQQQQT